MKRAVALLAAGLAGAPFAVHAQQTAPPPAAVTYPAPPPTAVTYPAPPVQPGSAYYCSRPEGWYPSVRTCQASWVTYVQQPAQYVPATPTVSATPPVATYAVPTPQPGMAYYCSAPEGWYPSVRNCSTAWMTYSQQPAVTYVVPAQPIVLVQQRPDVRTGPDAALAPIESGVNP